MNRWSYYVLDRSTLHARLYGPILVFLGLAIVLSAVILGASLLLATSATDAEKVSAYECGFDPFDDARRPFEVRFYIVAILFLLFDVEATFLFPWSTRLREIRALGFWAMGDFLFELLVGLVYAWKVGALEWDL